MVVAALLLLQAAPAAQPVAIPAAPQAEAPKPKKQCRKIEVIGSNLPRQECRSADEWKAVDAANQVNGQDRAQLQRMIAQGMREDGH